MDFSGFTVRYFTPITSGNFIFNKVRTSAVEYVTGSAPDVSGKELRIGFTGTTGNTQWYFAFRNGKIYDPQGRWFGSYDEASYTTLSGNFSSGDYSYYLDGEIIAAIGKKPANSFNGFFITGISGATGQADILVTSAPINTSLYMQGGFYVSGIWSGTFTNNHSSAIVIRSGELLLPDAVDFVLTGTGLTFNAGTNIVTAGGYRTVKLLHSGKTTVTGMYTLNIRVHTDYGSSDYLVSGYSVPYRAGYISNTLYPTGNTDYNVVAPVTGSGIFDYTFSTTYQNFIGQSQVRPFTFKFSYTSGYTGTFSPVTGIEIITRGGAFTNPTYIYITSTSQGVPWASGTANVVGHQVRDITWVTSGVYTGTTGTCAIVVAGPGVGTGFTANILWGPQYTKVITGYVSGITGYFGATGTNCSGTISGLYGSGNMPTGNPLLTCRLVVSGRPDNLSLRYSVTLVGLPDTTSGISSYSGSGLIYSS